MDSPVTWLATPSPEDLRRCLGQLVPGLADGPLVVNDRVVTTNPRYFQGSAVVDGTYVVKFAWSEAAGRRIVHEGRLLRSLADAGVGLSVPEVVATSAAPALLVTRLVPGEALSWQAANRLSGTRRRRLLEDLARFLAVLHQPQTLEAVGGAAVGPEPPEPQASTAQLREAFGRHVTPSEGRLVTEWCDWVDDVLAGSTDDALLHGDLHGHNLVWDPASGALRLVADFETAGPGDPAFDFRYLPGQAADVDLFLEVRHRYEQEGRPLDVDRVMAWHIRTALGDALWRTEAGVPLPGSGGSASSWVQELAIRMRAVLDR